VDWEADGTDEWFKKPLGARFEIIVDGKPRSMRDLKETAIDEISQAHAPHNEVRAAT